MIRAGESIRIVFAEPLRPFRINMAGGKSYEIRHPEVIQVGRNNLTVFTPLVEGEEESEEMWKKLSLTVIESIEPLEAPVAGNRE